MYHPNDPRVLSRPAKIYWAGWETDTETLQRYGWELSMEQNRERGHIRLGFRHRKLQMEGYAFQDKFLFEQYRHHFSPTERAQMPVFKEVSLAGQIQIHSMKPLDARFTHPIDARPQMVSTTRKRLEDFFPFKTVKQDVKEIVLTDVSIDEVLEFALQKQEPAQEKIRQRMINEKYKAATNVAAELRVAV